MLESGSGPGGRRFKSSLPDQSFQALKQHFWSFAYIVVESIVPHGRCGADENRVNSCAAAILEHGSTLEYTFTFNPHRISVFSMLGSRVRHQRNAIKSVPGFTTERIMAGV